MKEKIAEMYAQALYDDLPPNVCADQVLRLLDDSTRTFNVGDNVKWRGMDLIVVEVGIGEILIATSENVEDENYNDWWVGTQYVC